MTVAQFQCSSATRLAAILASDAAVPYRAHRDRFSAASFNGWAAARGTRLLCTANGAFETGTGAIAWKALPWDSELFGFPAARIDILAAAGGYHEERETAALLLERVIEDATTNGRCRHVVARVDSASLALSHALTCQGFELIDGIQTFALDLSTANLSEPPVNTRIATPSDAAAIGRIASTSFTFDRFHNDIYLGADVANRLHEAWARNSVDGTAADAVFLAISHCSAEASVEAFVTLRIDTGAQQTLGKKIATIPLVATSQDTRGKGAARRATAAALAWCHAQDVDIVEVGTQISNVPAARLYQSAGFRTTAISLTYRKWIE